MVHSELIFSIVAIPHCALMCCAMLCYVVPCRAGHCDVMHFRFQHEWTVDGNYLNSWHVLTPRACSVVSAYMTFFMSALPFGYYIYTGHWLHLYDKGTHNACNHDIIHSLLLYSEPDSCGSNLGAEPERPYWLSDLMLCTCICTSGLFTHTAVILLG